MSTILCFGELLLRLSPSIPGNWLTKAEMPVFLGGAELNVATALALWGEKVDYSTILPDNYLTDDLVAAVAAKKIGTSRILKGGNRIGTYYLPQGADLKHAGVIYDRAYSSFWSVKQRQIDWDKVLEGVSWFHFSAISPALNEDVAAVCEEGLRAASAKGITISVDLNYRAKLWQYGKLPLDIMPGLVQYCDVVMGNIWAAEKMLGINISTRLKDEYSSYLEQAEASSVAIMKQFPKCSQVANTFRFELNEGVKYYATLYREESLFVSREHATDHTVDRVGSGDTFMAGLIYGNVQGHASQQVIDFAAAAAFNKLFIKGDATTSTVEEIRKGQMNYA